MTMRRVVAATAAMVLAGTLLLTPAAVADRCHYCAWDDELGSGCILGCPVGDPDCWGLSNCETTETGCRGTGFCDPLPDVQLTAAGTALSTDASLLAEGAAITASSDGSAFLRRICDALILGRTYSPADITTIHNNTSTLVL
jgi:hypothetical protein